MKGSFREMDPLEADRTKMQVVRGKRERESRTQTRPSKGPGFN